MSYVLHFWDKPVPTTVAEADQIHTRLSAERTAQNPQFIELAKRLTERYPCITTLEEDDDGLEQGAWSDGPLDGETDGPVYSLGVQPSMLGQVVPFVAATAGALGLVVYDMQAAEVHLPDGKVLTLPGQLAVLKEGTVGVDLNGQQIGHIHQGRQLAEILPDTFLLSVRVCHLGSSA